jgi:outer membrane protein OmpA-like peptidoglycan-associated protein
MIEAERARELAAARGEQAELALREAELANATAQALRKQLDNLEGQQTRRGLMFTLGDVTFESGQAALRDNALDALDKLVAFIEEQPDKSISIEGHTDNVGSDATNLNLSQQRADNVKTELIRRGVSASRMDAVGLGEEFPVADNSTDIGRSQNRRVEVIILNSDDG